MSNNDNNYVYLVNAVTTNKFKIGVTANIRKRISGMQTSCPYRIRIVHACYTPYAYEIEKKLHERYSQQRVILELFELSETEIKEIIELLNLCHDTSEFNEVVTEQLSQDLLKKDIHCVIPICPECDSYNITKNGWHDTNKTVRRYKCKCCKATFKHKDN